MDIIFGIISFIVIGSACSLMLLPILYVTGTMEAINDRIRGRREE